MSGLHSEIVNLSTLTLRDNRADAPEILRFTFQDSHTLSLTLQMFKLIVHFFPCIRNVYTQKNVWLKQPEFRLFQPEKNVTESRASNSC